MPVVKAAETAAGSTQAGAAGAAAGSTRGAKAKRLPWRRPRVRPYQRHGLVSLRRAASNGERMAEELVPRVGVLDRSRDVWNLAVIAHAPR